MSLLFLQVKKKTLNLLHIENERVIKRTSSIRFSFFKTILQIIKKEKKIELSLSLGFIKLSIKLTSVVFSLFIPFAVFIVSLFNRGRKRFVSEGDFGMSSRPLV